MSDYSVFKVFTTGQVAEICKVAPRTVSKWFDSGRLRGYRIPGSKDRRIPRESLIEFLKRHGLPLGPLVEQDHSRVLVISAQPQLTSQLQQALLDGGFQVLLAGSAFEAGTQLVQFRPQAVLLDSFLGTETVVSIASLIKSDPKQECFVVGICPREEVLAWEERQVFDDCFSTPFDPALLCARLQHKISTVAVTI